MNGIACRRNHGRNEYESKKDTPQIHFCAPFSLQAEAALV